MKKLIPFVKNNFDRLFFYAICFVVVGLMFLSIKNSTNIEETKEYIAERRAIRDADFAKINDKLVELQNRIQGLEKK